MIKPQQLRRALGLSVVSLLAAAPLADCSPPEGEVTGRASSALTPPVAGEADVWITSDPSNPFVPGKVSFHVPSAQGAKIDLDDTKRAQTVDGFGAALTDASAAIIYRQLTPGAARSSQSDIKALLEELVGANGLRLNIIRVPIAASDSTWDAQPYSYDPWDTSDPLKNSTEGSADPNLKHFSLAHDETYIIPELQQIKDIVAGWSSTPVHFIATPWSPPGWMKESNNGMIGGTLQSKYLPNYADYLAAFVKGYADHGIPIYALVPQNEPGQPADYPSMTLPPGDEATFIHKHLAPKLHALDSALAKKHFAPVKIFGFDHNWGGNSGQDADGKADKSTSYPEQLLTDLQGQGGLGDLDGVSFHCYGGNHSSFLTTLHRKAEMAGKDIYLTECDRSQYNKNVPAQNGQPAHQIGENDSYAEGIQKLIYAMNNWSQSYLAWQLVLHPDGTPDQGHGCMGSDWNCIGTVSITPGEGLSGLTREWDYAYLGHASKWVDRGAQVVQLDGNDSKDVDGHGGKFESAAFVNPDGTRVLVGYNSSKTNRAKYELVWNGVTALDVDVPPRSAVTYKWTASGAAPVYSNPAPSKLNIGFNGGADKGGATQFDYDWTFFNTGSVQPAERICHTYVDWELASKTAAPNIDGPGGERGAFAAWLADAGAMDPATGHVHCDEVLVSFQAHDMHDVKTKTGTVSEPVPGAVCSGSPKHGPPCEGPSGSDYETAVKDFLRIDWATVSNFHGSFAFTPWNEPQNSAPDGNGLGKVLSPETAAEYYLILANVCAEQGCKVAAGDFASNGSLWPTFFENNCEDSDTVNTHVDDKGNAWCDKPSSDNKNNARPASYLDLYKNYIAVHTRNYSNLTGLPRYFAYHGWHDANQFIETSQKGHPNQCTTYGDCVTRKVLSSMGGAWAGAEIWDTEVGASQGADISDKLQAETAAFLIRLGDLAPNRMTRLYYTRLYNGPPHDGGELVSGGESKPTVRPALCVLAERLGSYAGATCPLPVRDASSPLMPNTTGPNPTEPDASVPDATVADTSSPPAPAVLAFQSGGGPGDLWTVAANGTGSDRGTAASGSPSLAALSGGGSAIAFQATSDGTLNVLDNTGTVIATGLQIAPGSDPSIAAEPGGGWAVAVQAFGNSPGVAIVTSADVASPTLTSIPMIQSPSLAVLATGYVVAFEATDGVGNADLNVLTEGSSAPVDTGLAMMQPSSPSIVALPTGGYEIAYQTPQGNLAVYGSGSGSSTNANLVSGSTIAPETNPSIVSNGGAGNYWVAYLDASGTLRVVDSSGVSTNPGSVTTTATHTSPCISAASNGSGYQVAFQTTGGTLSTATTAGVTSLGFLVALGTSPACVR